MQKLQSTKPNTIVIMFVQGLFALACVGALVQGVWLTAARQAFAANEFMAALTTFVGLALTLVPAAVTRLKLLPMPQLLHTAFVVFVFLAMYCGEMLHFYDAFFWWDTMLHFFSGVLFALVGYLVFLALNKDPEIRRRLHPVSVVLFAVLFAIACGVVWELFEFAGDCLLGMNMQRWQNSIPAGEWAAMQNVTNLSNPGLIDTMKDFINDTMGALLAIPLILRMAKRDNVYSKTNITNGELLAEMQPALPAAKPAAIPDVPAVARSETQPVEASHTAHAA